MISNIAFAVGGLAIAIALAIAGLTGRTQIGKGLTGMVPNADDIKKFFVSGKFAVGLAIVGLILLYVGYTGIQVRPADVADWGEQHWLWTLIVWGILAALVAAYAPVAARQTIQLIMGVVMIAMFIGIPLMDNNRQAPPVTCPQGSTASTKVCIIDTSWTKPVVPEDYTAAVGKSICYMPAANVEIKKAYGPGGTYWLFRAKMNPKDGTKTKVLLSYRFEKDCPSVL